MAKCSLYQNSKNENLFNIIYFIQIIFNTCYCRLEKDNFVRVVLQQLSACLLKLSNLWNAV